MVLSVYTSTRRAGRGVLARAILMVLTLVVSGLLVLGVLVSAVQASSVQLELKPGSQLWLEGKSTLHPFSSKATQINLALYVVYGEASANPQEILDALSAGAAVNKLIVDVPVKGLKSGRGALDDNLYSALKVGESPRIQFRLITYKVLGGPAADGAYSAKVTGVLTIAGKSRTVDFNVAAKPEKGGINIWGTEDLKMTEYGITPPTAMMGMIRTEDDITVNFDLSLGVKSAMTQN